MNRILVLAALILPAWASANSVPVFQCQNSEVNFTFSGRPYIGESCYDSPSGIGESCVDTEALRGSVHIKKGELEWVIRGRSFQGNLEDPTGFYYSTGRMIVRKNVAFTILAKPLANGSRSMKTPETVDYFFYHGRSLSFQGTATCRRL